MSKYVSLMSVYVASVCLTANGHRLSAVLVFCGSSACQLKPIRITDDEIKINVQ